MEINTGIGVINADVLAREGKPPLLFWTGSLTTTAGTVEAKGFARLEDVAWTHARESGRDGLITDAESPVVRQEITQAVETAAASLIPEARRLSRILIHDGLLSRAANADDRASKLRARVRDLDRLP